MPLLYKLLRFATTAAFAVFQTLLNKLRDALLGNLHTFAGKPYLWKTLAIREKNHTGRDAFTLHEILGEKSLRDASCNFARLSPRAQDVSDPLCRSTYRRKKYGQRLLDTTSNGRNSRLLRALVMPRGLASRRVAFLSWKLERRTPCIPWSSIRSEVHRWHLEISFRPYQSIALVRKCNGRVVDEQSNRLLYV